MSITRLSVIILLLALCGEAKTRGYHYNNNQADAAGDVKRPSAREIEKKFRPYLEHRIRGRESGRRPERSENLDVLTTYDYYALRRYWDELSEEFRALYKEAVDISKYKNYAAFISPKGKFKILYTTSGIDSVDITNTFHYGAGQEWNVWRNTPDKTGTPDYINEAAFALDSAYTMMVERFGFHKPLNAPDPNGSADYYTVLIVKQDPGLYGVTQLGGRDSNRGFKSHIEINSDWSGSEWVPYGYNKRPFDALRVTCSHELFHAVQYAVSWEVRGYAYLDNFSYGWTEGSAVLMEDIAFPEVKDYLQYITVYFNNPATTMLIHENPNYVYLNSILFKYLHERTDPGGSSIEFIKEMYDNNGAVKNIQFQKNLEEVSKSRTNKTWAEVLNGFHAESYFTGSRAKTGKFITDSEKMRSWPVPQRSANQPLKRTVKPYSAEFFWYTPQLNHPDELVFSFSGQTDLSLSAVDGTQWALSALVMDWDNSTDIVPIAMDPNGGGEFTLARWHDKQGVLLIATNGNPNTGGREITVKIENVTDTAVTKPQTAPVKIYPNTVSLRSTNQVFITGDRISDIKIYTADGKLAGYWNSGAKTANFKKRDDNVIEWTPKSANKGSLLPGTYYITAASPKSSKKTKIMVLP